MPNEEVIAIASDSTTARVRPPHWSPGDRSHAIQYTLLAGYAMSTAIAAGTIIPAIGNLYIDYPPVPRYVLQGELEALYERIAALEALAVAEPEPFRDISREEAREEIRTLFSGGEIIYMSDVAERLNLPDELVVEICLELAAEGELNRRDDTILGR
jgi:hypothetical protein